MAGHLRTELVMDALDMALRSRRPEQGVHHSGHGSQYTSSAFGLRCREAGVQPSMGAVGDAYDNALCESFFATIECVLLDWRRFISRAEAEIALFDYFEGWYNPRRRHSALDYLSRIEYEKSAAWYRRDIESSSPSSEPGNSTQCPGDVRLQWSVLGAEFRLAQAR